MGYAGVGEIDLPEMGPSADTRNEAWHCIIQRFDGLKIENPIGF